MIDILNLQKDIVLAPYTTYKIGGSADYFVVVESKDELVDAVIEARKNNIPYFILGTGANILIGDKGFRGLIIKNETKNTIIRDSFVMAESGVVIADLIELTKEKELSGLEHYAGIPSTVGGAIWQNLHFLSPDRKSTVFIESIFESAGILDEENNIQKVSKEFFNFGYDYSILHDKKILITEVTLKLTPSSKNEIQNQINENLKWRNEKQPQLIEFPSCGSVFKKIKGVGAGRLIEQVGLKGYQIGGARVSEKHANYLVNTGNAKASDVRNLIKLIQDRVKNDLSYSLEPEISFVGEF